MQSNPAAPNAQRICGEVKGVALRLILGLPNRPGPPTLGALASQSSLQFHPPLPPSHPSTH